MEDETQPEQQEPEPELQEHEPELQERALTKATIRTQISESERYTSYARFVQSSYESACYF